MRSWKAGIKASRDIAAAFMLAMPLAVCATQARSLLDGGASGLPRRVDLTAVPFHAQERFQCGPAALGMALNAAGISIAPDTLVSQVYVPQREGSLPLEMLAAARRNGAIVAVIPPRLNALLTEFSAGHPVIVLQNLSLPLAPLWHYAIAIVAALVNYEQTTDVIRAHKAYVQALRRRPLMGLGNTAYAMRDLKASEAALLSASDVQPGEAAALNNLANVLAEMGDLVRAAEAAEKAVSLGGPWHDSAAITLQAVRALQQSK